MIIYLVRLGIAVEVTDEGRLSKSRLKKASFSSVIVCSLPDGCGCPPVNGNSGGIASRGFEQESNIDKWIVYWFFL